MRDIQKMGVIKMSHEPFFLFKLLELKSRVKELLDKALSFKFISQFKALLVLQKQLI